MWYGFSIGAVRVRYGYGTGVVRVQYGYGMGVLQVRYECSVVRCVNTFLFPTVGRLCVHHVMCYELLPRKQRKHLGMKPFSVSYLSYMYVCVVPFSCNTGSILCSRAYLNSFMMAGAIEMSL